jgi:hypothetical protein
MISGMPKGGVPDNRRAALAAEPRKNDPRFEHRNMHGVLRCHDRPSTALATIQPAFTDPERLALAGSWPGTAG